MKIALALLAFACLISAFEASPLKKIELSDLPVHFENFGNKPQVFPDAENKPQVLPDFGDENSNLLRDQPLIHDNIFLVQRPFSGDLYNVAQNEGEKQEIRQKNRIQFETVKKLLEKFDRGYIDGNDFEDDVM